jgi:hypothetical protein
MSSFPGRCFPVKKYVRVLKLLHERNSQDVIHTAYRVFAERERGNGWCNVNSFAEHLDRDLEPERPQRDYREIREWGVTP